MNNNTISNTKTEVPSSIEMNDENYLNNLLECEKNLSNNYSIALNELSNEFLYQEIYPMFVNIQNLQRSIFELAFQKGWYKLEKAETLKITQKINELEKQTQELI